jgi:hypothetical protein
MNGHRAERPVPVFLCAGHLLKRKCHSGLKSRERARANPQASPQTGQGFYEPNNSLPRGAGVFFKKVMAHEPLVPVAVAP